MAKVAFGAWTDKNESFTRKIRANRIEEGVGIDILTKKAGIERSTYFSHVRNPEKITLRELRVYCNAAFYSRRKKRFIFDSMNTITELSFR